MRRSDRPLHEPDPPAADDTASISPAERARRTPRTTEHSDDTLSAPATPVVVLPTDPTDRYELAGVHARGGLGRVVKARDLRLGRTVAIKELLHRTAAGEARFVREALITARLEHPGIVPVHEAGRWPSGGPYYSMKLVSGRTLKELIHARKELDERVALLPHVIAVAEAIGYAHSRGVIHRDVKPANVVVGDFGETVVVDWGLAKDLTGEVADALHRAATDLVDHELAGELAACGSEPRMPTAGAEQGGTAAGKVMGTPSYMSPEQARGDEVDGRTDVFSLGALLYEVLVGEPPYQGSSSEAILARAALGPVPQVEERQPGAPPDLCAIVRKATAARPEDRYPSGKELAEDLKRFQTGQLVTARVYSSRTLVWRWALRHRALVAATIAFVVAAAAVAIVAVDDVVRERNEAERQRAAAERNQADAETRKDELVFLQAQASLRRDPTAAVAWLKDYLGSGRVERTAAMLDEARASGVARHVWRDTGWLYGVAFLPGGKVATAGMSGEVHLRDMADGSDRLLGRHTSSDGTPSGILSLEVSPDGRQLATADDDGAVALWDVATGARLSSPATGDALDHLAYSGDGRRLIAPPRDDSSRVLDTATAEVVWTAPKGFHAVAINRDGSVVLAASMEGELSRFALPAGTAQPIARLPSAVLRGALSPDERRLLVQSADDGIRLIELGSGEVVELGRQPAMFGAVKFSPSGRWAVAGGTDTLIHLYDLHADAADTVLRGHEDSIYHLLFTSDEQQLISASDDSTIRLWGLHSGEVRVLRGHDDDVVRLALSGDGRWLASAGLDASARLWSLAHEDSRVLVGHHGELAALFLAPDGQLRTADVHGRAARWPLTGDTPIALPVPTYQGWRSPPLLSPDGRWAGSARQGRSPILVDLATGAQRSLEIGNDGKIRSAAFSKDGSQLALREKSGAVTLWRLPDGAPRTLVSGLTSGVLGFSPDGKTLAIAGEDFFSLYDVATGARLASADLRRIGCEVMRVHAVVWSPDGRFVTTVSKRGRFPLWDVSTGRLIRLDAGGHGSTKLDFSPDGRWLAGGSTDRKVRIWQTATGNVHVLPGHTDLIMAVAFAPDGRTLASASYDKTVRLWQVGTWEARILRGHAASVDGLAFLPDGKLASGSRDGTIRIWNLSRELDGDPTRLRELMGEMTSAVIDRSGRATTPTPVRRAPG